VTQFNWTFFYHDRELTLYVRHGVAVLAGCVSINMVWYGHVYEMEREEQKDQERKTMAGSSLTSKQTTAIGDELFLDPNYNPFPMYTTRLYSQMPLPKLRPIMLYMR
jgi:hypothetical protein